VYGGGVEKGSADILCDSLLDSYCRSLAWWSLGNFLT
jgi:hypothetical protein